MSYLIRVVLPDRPGMLGAVATALGTVEADIVGVDVVEQSADGSVIDDFVVDLPPGRLPESLVSACLSVDGVRVEYVGRYPAGADLHRDLEAVEAMTEAPANAERVLVDLVPGVFRADWALLLELVDGAVHVEYGSPNAPRCEGLVVPWLPLHKRTRLDVEADWAPESWREAAAAVVPLGVPARALVLGRDGGPEVLDSEMARLAHLAALAQTVRSSR